MAGLKLRLNLDRDSDRFSDGNKSYKIVDGDTFKSDVYEEDGDELNTKPVVVGKADLSGEALAKISASLKPVLAGLKTATITFCSDGAIVQGSLCGQRLFVPLMGQDFTNYDWNCEPAVFTTSTDSKKTLLDAFKSEKGKTAVEVSFCVAGEAPARSLTQTVTYASETGASTATVLKYELYASSTIYPTSDPDTSFTLSKQHMGKLAALASRAEHEALTFALKAEGGFYVGTVCEVLKFEVNGSEMRNYPYSSANQSVLKFFTKTGRTVCKGSPTSSPKSTETPAQQKKSASKAAQQLAVLGSGSGKPFCLALDDTASFKTMMQKIRAGANGMDLCFYTSVPAPVLRIRLNTAASPSVFLFCTKDCAPMHELESISAVSGALHSSKCTLKKRSPKASSSVGTKRFASANGAAPLPNKKPKKGTGDKKPDPDSSNNSV